MNFLRNLSSDDGGSDGSQLFNVAIVTIFAREFLEGSIIIGQYRTVINKMDSWDREKKDQALQIVNRSALFASLVAIIIVIAIAVPLAVLSRDLNTKVRLPQVKKSIKRSFSFI
jgi:high-affinity iron transporter